MDPWVSCPAAHAVSPTVAPPLHPPCTHLLIPPPHHLPQRKLHQVDAVRDLGNYALCSRGHFQLGRRLTLNAVAEAPDTRVLASRLRKLRELRRTSAALSSSGGTDASASPAAAGGSASASIASGSQLSGSSSAGGVHTSASGSSAVPELEPYTAHAALRCAMPGHDLTATAGYNLQYVDSAGDVSHVPLAVSLDLASHDRADGLQYRVGLHQVGAGGVEMGLGGELYVRSRQAGVRPGDSWGTRPGRLQAVEASNAVWVMLSCTLDLTPALLRPRLKTRLPSRSRHRLQSCPLGQATHCSAGGPAFTHRGRWLWRERHTSGGAAPAARRARMAARRVLLPLQPQAAVASLRSRRPLGRP